MSTFNVFKSEKTSVLQSISTGKTKLPDYLDCRRIPKCGTSLNHIWIVKYKLNSFLPHVLLHTFSWVNFLDLGNEFKNFRKYTTS